MKFTYENKKNKQIAILDVLLTRKTTIIHATVFTKPTSTGDYINYDGICPEKYTISVIKTVLHRA